MSQSRSVRKDNIKYDVHYPATTPEIFVDGVDQTLQGFPVSKVVFYQTIRLSNSDDDVTQRQAALRLVIPTAALMEFCKNTLLSFGSDTTDFEKTSKKHLSRIAKVAESIAFKPLESPAASAGKVVATKGVAKKAAKPIR